MRQRHASGYSSTMQAPSQRARAQNSARWLLVSRRAYAGGLKPLISMACTYHFIAPCALRALGVR